MAYVNKANSCNRASIKFEISANTVRNGYKRYKAEGHYLPKKVGGKKGRVTPQELASYIKNNPDFILLDMGKYFKMSAAGAYYWLGSVDIYFSHK